ncbi:MULTISPECIES: ABC transporter permease [unclassified Acinetobacter]|uniref:ABC transporter permease n=1 Tax=unclassified Acinetobacter TaxID=196816 RepID=UPI0024471DFD|nr:MULTISPECIES: ABC transporter permease [unclassified Acinetobacter]MDH0030156.1 ABC transporter permease [Acinetobacter sp. GD04021]MDH0885012.1 ABC transporter permease [Acinetobacter sp. GD03873]MDH1082344.1 ABC transporter permease [Acinetobacter sp. GD03983]MDH2188547.1 ABC transporter permease [Acinetobacter sp. GD03645]MDH2201930.1 ABC transporter permease [Acinetobacter sp. GD03647]
MSITTDLTKHVKKIELSHVQFYGLVLPIGFIVLWTLASKFNWVNPKLIPAPIEVVKIAIQQFQQQEFWQGLGASLFRNLTGFVIGSVLAIIFGIVVGVSRWANYLFLPSFNVLRQISLFAWLPLITTFLDYGNSAKILFIVLSVFYPVALHTIDGVRRIPLNQYEVAKVYQFNAWQTLSKLILPAAAPQIFLGLQLGLIFAWVATIGAEFLLANYGVGLGNIVIRGRAALDVGLIVFGLIVIGFIGVTWNSLANWAERRILVWRR